MESAEREPSPSPGRSPLDPARPLDGVLHIYVAFDWGDEINLEKAKQLVPASFQGLPRRRRTPSSFAYRTPPLHISLAAVDLELAEVGRIEVQPGLTVYDFGAVSLSFRVPFSL